MLKKIQKWFFNEDVEELDLDDTNELFEEEEQEDVKLSHVKKETVVKEKEVLKKGENKGLSKMNINITVDEPVAIKKDANPMIPRSRLTPRKEEYEMPQVISPYFGLKDDEKEDELPILQPLGKSKKEGFNSVISPFYGNQHTKPMKTVKRAFTNDRDQMVAQEVELNDTNLSLDDIVTTKQMEEEDLLQFSLFGGSKRVQEESFTNEVADEEIEDMLPF